MSACGVSAVCFVFAPISRSLRALPGAAATEPAATNGHERLKILYSDSNGNQWAKLVANNFCAIKIPKWREILIDFLVSKKAKKRKLWTRAYAMRIPFANASSTENISCSFFFFSFVHRRKQIGTIFTGGIAQLLRFKNGTTVRPCAAWCQLNHWSHSNDSVHCFHGNPRAPAARVVGERSPCEIMNGTRCSGRVVAEGTFSWQ